MRQPAKDDLHHQGLRAFLPYRATVVAPDPLLRRRCYPSASGGGWGAAAEAEPRPIGSPGPDSPAYRRAVHAGRVRIREHRASGIQLRHRTAPIRHPAHSQGVNLDGGHTEILR